MTTPWREEFIPVNPFSRPGIPLRVVRNIVMHYTANPGASAANHVRYFGENLARQDPKDNKPDRYASAHLFVDPGDAVLIIPLTEQAYHASQANPYSIGVELCIEHDGTFHPETVRRAEQIVAELCKRYGLNPLRDVIRHFDVTGKVCPKPYIDDPAAWEAFRQHVDRMMKGEEDDMMKLEHDWQWKMLGDALDGLYRKSVSGEISPPVISDYTWAEKAYKRELTAAELAWLSTIIYARQQGVQV